MEEFPDDFGFIDWNKEFDFETTLGEGSVGSSDDSLSLFSNTSPTYSPGQGTQPEVSPVHHSNVSPSHAQPDFKVSEPSRNVTAPTQNPKDLTLDALLQNQSDPYTDQFVENLMNEARQRPLPSLAQNSPSPCVRAVSQPVVKRVAPYPQPQKRNSIEEIDKRIRKTPFRQQKIHATEKCQIVKIEPETETLSLETQEMLGVSGNGVLVKVEPQASLGQPRQYQPSVKVNGDLLSQACQANAIGMNSRGQMYKRTPQEIRAEERKIRNRESASISREKKKRHLEQTEARNRDLMAENNRLKAKNRELEDQLVQMQSELMRFRGSFATKRVLVSSTALLSVAVIGLVSFPAVPLPQIHTNDGTEISLSHDMVSHGRQVRSVSEMDSRNFIESDFGVDDVLRGLKQNKGFMSMLSLAQSGSLDRRRTIQRKLYEEFKISFRELRRNYPLKYQRGIENTAARSKASQLPPKAPKMKNQMCEPKVNGKEIQEIRQMFNTWKSNPNDEDTSDYILPENRTETALVRGSRKREWTHAEVLNSLGPLFNNNSYYMVSHQVIPIIAPINAQDNQSNPKITFVSPSERADNTKDYLEMYQIECDVKSTKTIQLFRSGPRVEQEDEDVRIEIEV